MSQTIQKKSNLWWKTIVLVLCAALILSNVDDPLRFFRACVDSVEKKTETVLVLVKSSSSASTIITMIPNDVGMPIAEQLAQLSKYYIFVLSTLYLEKSLLPVLAWVSPCLGILAVLLLIFGKSPANRKWSRRIACSFLALSIVLPAMIPAGIFISDQVEALYSNPIAATVEEVTGIEKELEALGAEEGSEKEKTGVWNAVTRAFKKVVNDFSDMKEWAKAVLNNYIKSLAIILVTHCVIPIVTVLFLFILSKRIVETMNRYSTDGGPEELSKC